MQFVYSVDGYSLMDSEGRWWVTASGTSHSPAVTMRSVSAVVPGMPGMPDTGREMRTEAPMNLRIMARSMDPAQRERYWEGIKALFTRSGTFELGRTVEGRTYTTRAKLRSISEPDFRPNVGLLIGTIQLTILDGLFHERAVERVWPLAEPLARTIVPHLTGNAAVQDWALRVTGPVTSVAVSDSPSGTGITWRGVLPAGRYLFLRGVSARISTSPTDWDGGGTDAAGGVGKPAAGLLELTPQIATGDLMTRETHINASATGTAASTALALKAGSAYV